MPNRVNGRSWLPNASHDKCDPILIRHASESSNVSGGRNFHADANGERISLVTLGRRYFTQLDRLTHPGLVVLETHRLQIVQQLMEVLKRRVLLRRKTLYPAPGHLPSAGIDAIRQISDLMIELLESTFGSLKDGDTLELIGRTHDWFAWGALRTPPFPGVRVPNNVPDGAAIFFFAEFGFLALESGMEAERWSLLLPILVRMPALYVRLFELVEPGTLPKPFDEFGTPSPYETYQENLDAYADALRSRFVGLRTAELSAILGLLARRAFSDVE